VIAVYLPARIISVAILLLAERQLRGTSRSGPRFRLCQDALFRWDVVFYHGIAADGYTEPFSMLIVLVLFAVAGLTIVTVGSPMPVELKAHAGFAAVFLFLVAQPAAVALTSAPRFAVIGIAP
jgi:hypothetical protein